MEHIVFSHSFPFKDNSVPSHRKWRKKKCLNRQIYDATQTALFLFIDKSRLNVTQLYECPIDLGVAAHFSLGQDRATEWSKAVGMNSQINVKLREC